MEIRDCRLEDLPQIVDIYNHYIQNTVVTFEEAPLAVADLQARFEVYAKNHPWLVCVDRESVIGYAYANRWKERASFRHTVEATIYLRDGAGGRGLGTALFGALLERLETEGRCHAILGCVTLPNAASEGLQERFGFRKVAHFTEVGRKFGRWLDVGYWQKIIGPAEPT